MEGGDAENIMKPWETDAREKQQYYYELFADRDWDCYKQSDSEFFLRNIGFAIYGPPTEEPNEANSLTGYNPDTLKIIRGICDTIRKHDVHIEKTDPTDVRVAIIYVILQLGKSNAPSPVFRVPKPSATDGANNIFIDLNCRVYMGWDNYLKHNKLPKCTYCYPRNGVYLGDSEDNVIVDFSTTPEGRIVNKLLNGVDKVGTVLSVGTTVVSLATLAVPVAGSVVLASAVGAAAVGAYGLGRSVGNIVDRKRHHQSIGLKDAQARGSWLALGANTLGMAAAGATKTTTIMASRGSVLGKTGQFVVNFTQVGSIAAGSLSVINGVVELIDKAKNGEQITGLEVFQLTSSILFITNSAINLKTAKTIYKETQQSVIEDFKASLRSNRHRKAYERLERNARAGTDMMNGSAKIIKSIKNISNPDEFFSGVVRMQEHHGRGEADISFTDTGHVEINNEMRVDPSKFASMDKANRKIVLQASKDLAQGTIDRPQFESTVNPICEQFGVDLHSTSTTSAASASNTSTPMTNTSIGSSSSVPGIMNQSPLTVASLPEINIAGGSAFAHLGPSDLQRVVAIIRRFLSPDILAVAVKLADALGYAKTAEFVQFLEFSSGFIYQILNDMIFEYEQAMNEYKYSSPNFDQNQYDRNNGIQGNRTQFFLNLIGRMYAIGRKCCQLREAYVRHTLSMAETSRNHPSNVSTLENGSDSQSTSNRTVSWSDVVLPANLAESQTVDEGINVPESMDISDTPPQASEADLSDQTVSDLDQTIVTDCTKTMHIPRDFETLGALTAEEIYEIAHLVTGAEATKYNAAINFYEEESIVVIMHESDPDRIVLVSSYVKDNKVFAQELC